MRFCSTRPDSTLLIKSYSFSRIMNTRTSAEIKKDIEKRFGFFPPFYLPAMNNPVILENLWNQTLLSYIENPLPDLFKEKLAALLGRYCTVPYCLICHSSTLRPLGMKAGEILELLEMPALSYAELAEKTNCLTGKKLEVWPEAGSHLEECILYCCVAIFLNADTEKCHEKLRRLLTDSDYNHLILFLAYNRTALSWAEAHPELSANADKRAMENLGPLLDEEPKLKDFFQNYLSRVAKQEDRRLRWLTDENKAFVEQEKNLRETAEASANSLASTIEELEREKDLRERFVAALSHDLRTPLAAAKMSSELIARNHVDDPVLFKAAHRITNNMNRADGMIRDILDASLIKAGERIHLRIQLCQMNKILNDVIEDLEGIHGDKFQIKIEENIEGYWDPDAVKRILENLLSNAIKYGEIGSKVTVTSSSSAQNVHLSVHNKGFPIPENELSTLFDQFKRSQSAHRGEQKGWGLGLTLVKGIAESHGGKVSVESSNEGTTFTVELPKDSRYVKF